MSGMAKNQLRVLWLLAEAFARGEEEMAGIQVADSIGGLGRSSAYAALAALQRDGMVKARWVLPDEDGGHPRRLFKITVGQAALSEAQRAAPARGMVWQPEGA